MQVTHSFKKHFIAASAVALGLACQTVAAIDITGAGATFPYPIYAKWADAYKQNTGIGLNYQSIGSGGGIKQITAKTVAFGASDMPMKPEDLENPAVSVTAERKRSMASGASRNHHGAPR